MKFLGLAALSTLGLSAQEVQQSSGAASPKPPVYDIASIKPNKSGGGSVNIDSGNGTMVASNVSIAILLEMTYGYKREQIVGLEGPVGDARFDMRAKVVDQDPKVIEKMTPEEQGRMLEPILFDRFHLKFHKEMRTLPVYELVLTKNGAKFIASDKNAASDSKFHGLSRGSVTVRGSRTASELIAHDAPLSALVSNLSTNLRRIVVDKTGLTGNYDYWLRWTPEDRSASVDRAADNGLGGDVAPTLFTALQEQLGLKLQSGKDPVETIVIDQIAMPSED